MVTDTAIHKFVYRCNADTFWTQITNRGGVGVAEEWERGGGGEVAVNMAWQMISLQVSLKLKSRRE